MSEQKKDYKEAIEKLLFILVKYSVERLMEMSPTELKAVKDNRYNTAVECDFFWWVSNIARELGEPSKSAYTKFDYSTEVEGKSLRIHVDDYGRFMQVHLGGDLVASTHNERMVKPGAWILELADAANEAYDKVNQRNKAKEEAERQEILKDLI